MCELRELHSQSPNASLIGTSLAFVSASSATGSEPATMPAPANSRIRRRVVRVGLAAAQRDAPLAVAGRVHPADRSAEPAALHALDLTDQVARDGGRRTADRRGRVQRGGQAERGGAVGGDAGDVGGQVHHVRQVQHERGLGHVHRLAVRLQRVGDRADRELVLLQVLARPGQRRGQRQVVRVVAGTADGPGQHAGRDQALLPPDQQLRGGADQPVDGERPAVRVRRRPAGATASAGRSAARRSRSGRGPAPPCRARRR